MAGGGFGDMTIDEAIDYFANAGIDVGGNNLRGIATTQNGERLSITVYDRNGEVWLWDNVEPDTWKKLPRVPVMTVQKGGV